jgi:hypothetical protein
MNKARPRCEGSKLKIRGRKAGTSVSLGTRTHDMAWENGSPAYYDSKNIFLIKGKPLLRTGFVCASQELCPDEEVYRSEFLNHWVLPRGDICAQWYWFNTGACLCRRELSKRLDTYTGGCDALCRWALTHYVRQERYRTCPSAPRRVIPKRAQTERAAE